MAFNQQTPSVFVDVDSQSGKKKQQISDGPIQAEPRQFVSVLIKG